MIEGLEAKVEQLEATVEQLETKVEQLETTVERLKVIVESDIVRKVINYFPDWLKNYFYPPPAISSEVTAKE